MRLLNALCLLSCVAAGIAGAQSTTTPPGQFLPGKRVTVAVPLQPWQERRALFAKTLKAANAHDAGAMKDFNEILTQFETQPFARTPMENMDLLGTYYAPKDDIAKTLIIVSANAALGWYDALRFASESGRAEIVNNERFFARAFLLSGPPITARFKEFMKEHPDVAAKSVQQGLVFAERERKNPHYDTRWPTAYGLERMICAEGGACSTPAQMPADQWERAWEDAKKRVTAYYAVSTQPPPAK